MILMFSTSGKSFYRLSENMPDYLNKSLNGKFVPSTDLPRLLLDPVNLALHRGYGCHV